MKKTISLISAMLFAIFTMNAKITLPDIMSDHMVLQQQSDARIWGWAENKSKIAVIPSWNNEKYTTTADENGYWEVKVSTPEASYTSHNITIKEGKKDTATLNDILIGEVWVASGQSNMNMPLAGFECQPVEGGTDMMMRCGKYKGIRVAVMERKAEVEPQSKAHGKWMLSNPENAKTFSAAAYFFAVNLNEILDVPVGLITASWGGASIHAWMSEDALKEVGYEDIKDKAANVKMGRARPTVMYNAMLYPVHNYTIKGFLWYQGCANVKQYKEYPEWQAAMVKDWRKVWGQGELPFYFVELAPFQYTDGGKVYLFREAQQKAMDIIPNCGMASTGDLVKSYERNIIHPTQKRPVGERLAMLALQHTYKVEGILGDCPRFKSMKPYKNGMSIKFTNIYNGITPTGEIKGFEVAGEDRKFYPAKASIRFKEHEIYVSCPKVKEIVAVRYNFHSFYTANLWNTWHIPVLPFRTDEWPM